MPLAREWVGKNQAKKKGFASLPPVSSEEFGRGGQVLAVNEAMEGEKGVLENAPWLITLILRSRNMQHVMDGCRSGSCFILSEHF